MIEKQKLNRLSSKHHLPPKAKTMFRRRFEQIMKRYNDENKAENAALSFVRTRYKKVKGKWIEK